MRSAWIVAAVSLVSPFAFAQTTIYKHVDESGRVTYTNKPMKGAVVLDIDPAATAVPLLPPGAKANAKPAVAVVNARPSLASNATSIDRDTQKGREDVRRKILEEELRQEEASVAEARKLLAQEQQNPTLIAAVRLAQETPDPTPAQQAEMRKNIDKASGRIRGLQATVSEHEKNIEALKKELGALKP